MLLFRQLLVIAQDIFSSHNVVDYLFYADLEVKGHTGKKNEKKKEKNCCVLNDCLLTILAHARFYCHIVHVIRL